MANFGRNFGFRRMPWAYHRRGRFYVPTPNTLLFGTPVVATTTVDAARSGAQLLAQAGAAQVPVPGQTGLIVWEMHPSGMSGRDPNLTDYSDIDRAKDGELVQLVHGVGVKVVLRNTAATTFGTRTYAARKMIDLTGLAVGDYLRPLASPSDTNGYWTKQSGSEPKWLVVTSIDSTRNEVEAELQF